jgi:exosortase/archaeosortase family protein
MKLKLSGEQKRLFDIFLFLFKLLLFAIPLYIILFFHGVLFPLQIAVSQNVEFLLNSFGLDVLREGIVFKVNGFLFLISEDCTGWKSMLFLAALLFAVPRVDLKRRLIGLAAGLLLIYIGNLARILIMVSVSLGYEAEFASLVHDWFWQFGLVSLVLLIWIAWLAWAGKAKITFLNRLHKLIKPR